MALTRRDFLEKASLALAAFGMGETWVGRASDRYYQALADPAPQKLALLVGIDDYEAMPDLSGCATDVELQRKLLIHRFGFDPNNIVTLIDKKATRQNIEETFISHLSDRAGPRDIVVFHFSGYGRRINGEQIGEGLQNSLIPVDGGSPEREGQEANDILESTLEELLRTLPTERAIAVLDTSYSYPGMNLQGNLRIRAQQGLPTASASDAELAFREKIKPRGGFLQRSPGPIKGIILAASGADRVATEARWTGFSAGVFTYALTQQLWLATPGTTLRFSLQRASCAIQQTIGDPLQQPELKKKLTETEEEAQTRKIKDGALAFFDMKPPSADGVVEAVEDGGQSAVVWLGGLPSQAVQFYEANSILTPLAKEAGDDPLKTLQVRSRDGLRVKAQVLGTGSPNAQPPSPTRLRKGQLVQEKLRVLPRSLNLTIALDSGLQRIERVDATSAFAGIPRVSTAIAGEQNADYLFGRAREAMLAQLPSSSLPSIPEGSYALFSPGKSLLLNTMGERGEAIKTAAQRLKPELEKLLAAKFLRLSANEGSSKLGVRASLETVAPEEKVIIQTETRRSPWPAPQKAEAIAPKNGNPIPLSLGDRIRYRLVNYSDKPVYCLLFSLDNSDKAIVLYPSPDPSTSKTGQTQPHVEQNQINPGETLIVPNAAGSASWVLHGQAGLTETQVIFSTRPFSKTFYALASFMRPQGDAQPIISLRNPLAITQAILQDLHAASAANLDSYGGGISSNDSFALDVNSWATLSFIYRVV